MKVETCTRGLGRTKLRNTVQYVISTAVSGFGTLIALENNCYQWGELQNILDRLACLAKL